ncbi:phospho-N-acetylmuramoyl-pentapeptide-transferase [Paenibacillus tarimensis]
MSAVLSLSALSFLIVACLTPILIWALRTMKLTQPIRKEMYADIQAKRGTPLMAGLIFLIGAAASLSHDPSPLSVFLTLSFVLFSLIGFIDDFSKAYYQDPAGISSRTKLLLQFPAAAALLLFLYRSIGVSPDIALLNGYQLQMSPMLYIVTILLFVVGSANAINFTDGLDGLLPVVAIPTYFFFFAISDRIEVQMFSLTMAACLLGFLIYNIFPAKAFMGDTGSLAIGASLAFLAVIEKVEILVPVLFFIYFAEQCSVILQIRYYKKTGKRLFKMAPVHYHFILKYGWSENKLVIVFGAVSWGCALTSWLLWKYAL